MSNPDETLLEEKIEPTDEILQEVKIEPADDNQTIFEISFCELNKILCQFLSLSNNTTL